MVHLKTAGYSGTPLSKKLGIVANSRLLAEKPPGNYRNLLKPIPSGTIFENKLSAATDIIHVFAKNKLSLKKRLIALRNKIRPDAAVWVSWPKKSSKVQTDITEDAIREIALPLGFVDIKVCAVDDVWSGLKLVIRKELR